MSDLAADRDAWSGRLPWTAVQRWCEAHDQDVTRIWPVLQLVEADMRSDD